MVVFDAWRCLLVSTVRLWNEEEMVILFTREVATNTKLNAFRVCAIRDAKVTAVWHDHRVTPISADIVEPFFHLFHDEQGPRCDGTIRCDNETVFGNDGASRQDSRRLMLIICGRGAVYKIVDEPLPVRRGAIGSRVEERPALIGFSRSVSRYPIASRQTVSNLPIHVARFIGAQFGHIAGSEVPTRLVGISAEA